MNLEDAIIKHTEWKIKLCGAIINKEEINVATISVDNQCELGKWLHGGI